MTPEQSRAASAWLNWSQSDLADRANVSLAAVVSFETGRRTSHRATITDMRTALEQGGVRLFFADELGYRHHSCRCRSLAVYRSESEVTLADVEAVKLPLIVNGRRLYQNSKRALIIKAIIVLLKREKLSAKNNKHLKN